MNNSIWSKNIQYNNQHFKLQWFVILNLRLRLTFKLTYSERMLVYHGTTSKTVCLSDYWDFLGRFCGACASHRLLIPWHKIGIILAQTTSLPVVQPSMQWSCCDCSRPRLPNFAVKTTENTIKWMTATADQMYLIQTVFLEWRYNIITS
jgi:hypothetical protein